MVAALSLIVLVNRGLLYLAALRQNKASFVEAKAFSNVKVNPTEHSKILAVDRTQVDLKLSPFFCLAVTPAVDAALFDIFRGRLAAMRDALRYQ